MTTALYVGLMSGTSMDGVDGALCEFEGGGFRSVVRTHHRPYPSALRERLLSLQTGDRSFVLNEFAALDQEVAQHFALAAQPLCAGMEIIAIGSHGQTVFHDPDGLRNSLQIGNPSLIAAQTGVPVVADFRRADLALGGQGAPLVPAFHRAVFSDANETRCVVNVGGIANLSLLPNDRSPVRGWDTGPGNGLMDEWIRLHQSLDYDAGGSWGSNGQVHSELLNALLADPYFRRPAPKSTGRRYFNLEWLRRQYPTLEHMQPVDVQRTLCELTAQSISQDIGGCGVAVARVLLCGGGALNHLLVARLQALLPASAVETTASHGLRVEAVEAAAFAWLAQRRMSRTDGNLPQVTGASRPAVLGAIYHL